MSGWCVSGKKTIQEIVFLTGTRAVSASPLAHKHCGSVVALKSRRRFEREGVMEIAPVGVRRAATSVSDYSHKSTVKILILDH